jgi:hypothetical protein
MRPFIPAPVEEGTVRGVDASGPSPASQATRGARIHEKSVAPSSAPTRWFDPLHRLLFGKFELKASKMTKLTTSLLRLGCGVSGGVSSGCWAKAASQGVVARRGRVAVCIYAAGRGSGADLICNAQRRVSTRPSHAPASSRHLECTCSLIPIIPKPSRRGPTRRPPPSPAVSLLRIFGRIQKSLRSRWGLGPCNQSIASGFGAAEIKSGFLRFLTVYCRPAAPFRALARVETALARRSDEPGFARRFGSV